ncbi:MAG: response regulator [Candidatus Thermoplasmatota archaeon]|nr:response regulator [Candidatus Thermoplasmatota archaeon]
MTKKIMVVDDEKDILLALETFFKSYDVDLITVNSGKACIKEVERGFKGTILVDLMMPKMTGWDTIEAIVERGLNKGLIIDVITGKGSRDKDKLMKLAPYINDYISKPFDQKTLERILAAS